MTDVEALYKANHDRLFRYFSRAVGHAEDARELTQDVFVRVSRSVIPNGPEGAVRGWSFRIARNLALDTGSERAPASEDVELTMRPRRIAADGLGGHSSRQGDRPPLHGLGQSRPAGRIQCHHAARVGGASDRPLQERRLMGADLGLIERQPNGAERTQSLAVRGLPHHEIPFYFDAIRDGARSLEIFGSVVVRPESDGAAIELATNCRWGAAAFDWRERQTDQVRQSDSQLRVKPGETVEVALRPLDSSADPFAARRYAIRIRAQQLR